jgi:ribonuclease-3
LDQGIEPVRQLVHRLVLAKANEAINGSIVRDAKSRLQEAAQSKVKQIPAYQVLSQSGPDHNKIFVVGVYFDSELVAEGMGSSKNEAEQSAAGAALEARGWGVASTAA